jgi:ribosomal protein S18 acetylase RimI-like enzyme
MTSGEYERWVRAAIASYAEDKVASGQWSPDESLERSAEEHAKLLPRGLSTPGNHLFSVLDGCDQPVGMLWFAVKTKFNAPVAYVYNIEIDPKHRRRGHAYHALLALEDEARRLGLGGVALHVFGHNTTAQALYAKLGYAPTNINLYKPLAESEA